MGSSKILLSLCLCLVLMASACKQKTPVEPEPLQSDVPQWAMFGKNLRNTSNAADPVEYYSGPQQGEIVWTVQFGLNELCFTSPSIGPEGTIYMATASLIVSRPDTGFIYAIHPDGTIKWRFITEERRGAEATGAVGSDGTYFIGSSDKYFYAIDRDGKVKWKKEFPRGFNRQRPALTAKGEIILSVDSGIMALDARTGKTIWLHESTSKSAWAVSLDRQGNIYTGTNNGLLALSPNGQKRWEYPTPTQPILEPVIANDGIILFTTTDSLLYALNPDGSLKWTFNQKGARANIPCIANDGTIITLNSAKFPPKLYKLRPNGQLLWGFEMAELVGINFVFLNDSHPIVDLDGTIYLAIGGTGDGNFFAIDSTGEKKWGVTIENSFTLIFPRPALAPDGTLYIAGDRTLNAVR